MSNLAQHEERDPDNPPPSGPFTHWVDTNVMLEVYSHGDLFEAFESWQRGRATVAVLEDRRVRMQNSLWMTMALCKVGARSMAYQHESLRQLRRLAPPGSTRGLWTSAILYFIGDGGVFRGWEGHLTTKGDGFKNRERDALMVQECRSDGSVLITRDAELRVEARAVGVDAVDPETFAARHLPIEDARRMFDQRIGDAALRYLVIGPPQEQNARIRVGRHIREAYGYIWRPPDQPVFV